MGRYRGGVVGASQSKTWKRKWRMTTFTTADRLEAEAIALKGQNPIQTKYGALYYEDFNSYNFIGSLDNKSTSQAPLTAFSADKPCLNNASAAIAPVPIAINV